ncbi:MAG: YkgJ family cysteine cluster protein [Candidatus Magnetoovum sp. WYHC-5]|nr:YkgJ family cysteine cluster protein [Candidatus Magnetoovum sp. WYHC-5]
MQIITPFGVQALCKRCGECCEKGSPTLHISDSELIKNGTLTYSDLFTIREGELVYNNIDDEFVTIDYELIKLREKPSGRVCIFYNEDSKECPIYENRPNQCRAYECWDTQKFMTFFNSEEKLTREHIIYNMGFLKEIVNKHEVKCSYANLSDIVQRIQKGTDMVSELFEIIEYDNTLRHFLTEKSGIHEDHLPLLLGRPIIQTIIMYGYRIESNDAGTYTLVAI